MHIDYKVADRIALSVGGYPVLVNLDDTKATIDLGAADVHSAQLDSQLAAAP